MAQIAIWGRYKKIQLNSVSDTNEPVKGLKGEILLIFQKFLTEGK